MTYTINKIDRWTIIFYQTARGEEPVKEYIDKLETKQQAKVYSQIGLLKEYGLLLPAPYLKKLTGTEKLWELRISNYRIFLSPIMEKRILLIHMITKKTNKTPRHELKLAEKRLKDFLEGETL